MGVKINGGGTATSSDLSLLERTIDAPLDPAFLEFVKHNDGGTPEPNIFSVGSDNDADVSQFIPVEDIPKVMSSCDDLPTGAFPIAYAAGGNFVLIDATHGGSILFWDHELPHAPTTLAKSFDQFLHDMKPFDINSVELSAHRVRSVSGTSSESLLGDR
jgi:hypothetical protein